MLIDDLPRLSDDDRESLNDGYVAIEGTSTPATCQEGQCSHRAKYLSPTGLRVCGIHRRLIDAWYERLRRTERCCEGSGQRPATVAQS